MITGIILINNSQITPTTSFSSKIYGPIKR